MPCVVYVAVFYELIWSSPVRDIPTIFDYGLGKTTRIYHFLLLI